MKKALALTSCVLLILSGCVLMILSVFFTSPIFAEKNTPPLRVLFIGNSYTHFNGLPEVLSNMAATAKPKVNIKTAVLTRGGYTLEKHLNEESTLNLIQKGEFDIVILQEQSLRPISDKKKMHEAIRKLHLEIKKAKAKTVLFMTWARANRPKMIEPLAKAYIQIGRELKVEVAPIGLAWQKALQKLPNLSLHNSDKSHPNQRGTYLTACVLYATLTGKSPVGLSNGGLKEITNAQAAFLQQIAWETFKKQSTKKPDQAHHHPTSFKYPLTVKNTLKAGHHKEFTLDIFSVGHNNLAGQRGN